MARTRGVRGAASWCAIAALLYLLVRSVLYAGISAALGLVQTGASLSKPIGISDVTVGLLQLLIGLGAILIPLWAMLRFTRLQPADLRIVLPAPWSPAFCLPVFLSLANTANLAGALLAHLLGIEKHHQHPPQRRSGVVPSICSTLRSAGHHRGVVLSRCPAGVAAALRQCCRHLRSGAALCATAPGSHSGGLRPWSARCFWAGWPSVPAVFCRVCCCTL